jgi:hypothetical protein
MNGYNDIIIRLPGVEEVTSSVRFDGGGSATGEGDQAASMAAAGANTVVVVRRQINFYGLSFAGRGTGEQADGTGACIAYRVSNDATLDLGKHALGGGNFHTVRGCNFRDDGGNNTVGIYEFGAGGAEISECTFGYHSAARGPTGIMIRGSATNNNFDIHVNRCLFRQCPVGIVLAAGTHSNLAFTDNVFQSCTIGFQADSGCSGTGIIAGSRFDVADGGHRGELERRLGHLLH